MTCRRVKAWLSQNEVPFVERNVEEDEDAASELKERGYMTVPTLFIGDVVLKGFDEDRLEQLLFP